MATLTNEKIKLFNESHTKYLEIEVNDWIKEERPIIIDIRFSTTQSNCKNILILYREGQYE